MRVVSSVVTTALQHCQADVVNGLMDSTELKLGGGAENFP